MSIANKINVIFALQDLLLVRGGGCLERLVELSCSMNANLRLHAVWALQNLAYKAPLNVKTALMERLSWDTLRTMFYDADDEVQVSICFLGAVQQTCCLLACCRTNNDDPVKYAGSTTFSSARPAQAFELSRKCLLDRI